jgi:hypothetical protein
MRGLNGKVGGASRHWKTGTKMENTSRARLIATDFAASLLVALSIGVATSVMLAGAVVLLAQSSPELQSSAPQTTSVAETHS